MSKCINECLAKQEKIKTSGDYLEKTCAQCSEVFFASKHSNAEYCCVCRVAVRIGKRRLAKANRIHPLEGFPRDQFQNRYEMESYLKGDGLAKIQCLLCGHWYGRLGIHIPKAHNMEVSEYKVKFGIPFHGHGLIGQRLREHCSELGKKQAATLTPEKLIERQSQMMVAMKNKGIKKNLTPYYHKELAEQSVIASRKKLEKMLGKKAIAPCSRCGTETEVSLIASVNSACILYCKECKKKANKEKAKKCYEGMKLDQERWNHYLERMRNFNKSKRQEQRTKGSS